MRDGGIRIRASLSPEPNLGLRVAGSHDGSCQDLGENYRYLPIVGA